VKPWWRRPEADEFIDLTDYSRRVLVAEAVYQAAADRESGVLRVSGKVPRPTRRLAGIVERKDGR